MHARIHTHTHTHRALHTWYSFLVLTTLIGKITITEIDYFSLPRSLSLIGSKFIINYSGHDSSQKICKKQFSFIPFITCSISITEILMMTHILRTQNSPLQPSKKNIG